MVGESAGEQSVLPSPDGPGVYTFSELLWEMHERVGSPVPTSEPRVGSGVPIVALEPHPDDLVLSCGGRLLLEGRELYVISVCSESRTVHPGLASGDEAPEEIAGARRAENRAALAMLGAEILELGWKDAGKPYRPTTGGRIEELLDEMDAVRARLPDSYELLAPAAVTRHPDHVLVHEAARRLGCRWFWEDVGFFPTYARSVEDRRWFTEGHGFGLVAEHTDISAAVLKKVAMLSEYRTQACSPEEITGVLRYAWAVGAEAGETGAFMERNYRSR